MNFMLNTRGVDSQFYKKTLKIIYRSTSYILSPHIQVKLMIHVGVPYLARGFM